MSPGYAMLPTLEKPHSNHTIRLSSEEMKERNEWIINSYFYDNQRVADIAHEVGLSCQRVQQILRPLYKNIRRGLRVGDCGRCGIHDEWHPKPPVADMWYCPDVLIVMIAEFLRELYAR